MGDLIEKLELTAARSHLLTRRRFFGRIVEAATLVAAAVAGVTNVVPAAAQVDCGGHQCTWVDCCCLCWPNNWCGYCSCGYGWQWNCVGSFYYACFECQCAQCSGMWSLSGSPSAGVSNGPSTSARP